MNPAEQVADAGAPLPHEAATYCGHKHDAHVAALVLDVRRRSAAQALRTLHGLRHGDWIDGRARKLRGRTLTNHVIRELLASLREHVGMAEMTASWPTPRAQWDIVKDVTRHAQELREALGALPPGTRQHLWLEVSRVGLELPSIADLDTTLLALAIVGNAAAGAAPKQAHGGARVGIAARVHGIAGPSLESLDIEMSSAAGSVFHTVCAAAFVLAGATENPIKASQGDRHPKPTDPAGAIRAYIARREFATGK